MLFALTKAPQYANLDYSDAYGAELDKAFTSIPRSRSALCRQRPLRAEPGHRRRHPQALGRAQALAPSSSSRWCRQKVSAVEGLSAFVFSLPPLPGLDRRAAGADGDLLRPAISSRSSMRWRRSRTPRARAGCSSSSTAISPSTSRRSRSISTARKANELGVTMQAIGDTLALLVGENYVNRFNLGGRSYEVIPQVPRADRLTPETLTQLLRHLGGGPAGAAVDRRLGQDDNRAQRADPLQPAQFRDLPGGADAGRDDGPGGRLPRAAGRRSCPPGFSHDYLSDSRQYVQEGNQLVVTFVFALIVIFLVLAAQFESLRDPLVILVSVPMSICGALMPLFFGLATMNIYTQVGLVTLIGLISKHGILMVEFANQLQLSEGLDRRRAIERAARVRLRPILMTTAAMVVGPGAAADRHRAPARRAASRSASSSSPACRSARCSRCSCCRRSIRCWPRTTPPPRARCGPVSWPSSPDAGGPAHLSRAGRRRSCETTGRRWRRLRPGSCAWRSRPRPRPRWRTG